MVTSRWSPSLYRSHSLLEFKHVGLWFLTKRIYSYILKESYVQQCPAMASNLRFRPQAHKLKLWWDHSVRMSMCMHVQCVFNQVSIFNVSIWSCITTAQQWRPFWIFHLNTNRFSDKNHPYNTPLWNWRSSSPVVSDKNNFKIFSDRSLFVLLLRWSFGFTQKLAFCEDHSMINHK